MSDVERWSGAGVLEVKEKDSRREEMKTGVNEQSDNVKREQDSTMVPS